MPIYRKTIPEEEKTPRYSLFSPKLMRTDANMENFASTETPEIPKSVSLFSNSAPSTSNIENITEEPKKKGFGTKVKEFFTGKTVDGGVDEYGLEKPDTYKKGIGAKILDYLLPMAFAATGNPIMAAANMSYFGNESGKAARSLSDMKNYQDRRKTYEKNLQPTTYEKDLNTYFNLTPEKRSLADQKAAASKQLVNPLDMAKFQHQLEQDAFNRNQKMQDAEKGAQLPADKALVLSDGSNLPRVLGDLREAIKQNQSAMGPVAGRLRKLNPFDIQAQVLGSQVEAAKQLVGKFMEGGVLRAEDVPKYDRILAGLYDDPATALEKINNMQRELEAKYNQHLTSLRAAKFDVSGFSPLGMSETPKPRLGASLKKTVKPRITPADFNDDDLNAELAKRGL